MKTLEQLIEKSNAVKSLLANNGIELNDNILIKVYGESLEMITCTDETLSVKVFGGDVTVYGYRDFKSKVRKIELNTGSLGSFDINCVASTTKVMTQAAILKGWSVFVEITTALMNEQEVANQLSRLNSNI
tara:strand:- start:236 stop:628 length:393 start_codon:yes stop_codon:yes gene_type:complete